MTTQAMDKAMAEVKAIIKLLEMTPEQWDAALAATRAARAARVQRHNDKFHRDLYAGMDDAQEAVVTSLVANGHEAPRKFLTNRATGELAVMLQKQCWNHAKGRMGTKLVMVYPNGRTAETFERTISVRW